MALTEQLRKSLTLYVDESYDPYGSAYDGFSGLFEDSGRENLLMMFNTAELKEAVKQPQESFAQMLLRKIDESSMTDPECYRAAGIHRSVLSAVRSKGTKPSKKTIFKFAIALRLPLEETEKLLSLADHAIDHSKRFDLTVKFFIERGIYKTDEIDDGLVFMGETALFSEA